MCIRRGRGWPFAAKSRSSNGHGLRVVKVKGTFIWHKHDDTEDFSLVSGGSYRVHWCGHGQEGLPIPGKGGNCDLVPVIGEAG